MRNAMGRGSKRVDGVLLVLMGFAYWACANLMFSLQAQGLSVTNVSSDGTWFTVFGNIVALAAVGFGSSSLKTRTVVENPALVAIACICLLLGCAIPGLVDLGLVAPALLPAGGFFGGVGQGFSLVFLAELFGGVTLYQVLLFSGLQQVLAVVPFLLFAQQATAVTFVATLCLIAVQYAALVALQSRRRRSAAQAEAGSAPDTGGCPDPQAPRSTLPAGMAVAALVVGACYGLTLNLTATSSGEQLPPHNLLGAVAGGALLMLSAALFRRKRFGEYFYQIVVPLLALGLAAIPLLDDGVALALPLLAATGSYCFGLVWFLVAMACERTGGAPTRPAALAFLFLELGHLAARGLFGWLPPSFKTAGGASAIMLFAIVVLLVILLPQQERYQKRLRRESERRLTGMACERLGQACGLTPRELDVLRLCAEGGNAHSIAASLTLSETTVNTHLQHIYQKTGVHTRDELLARLRGEQTL